MAEVGHAFSEYEEMLHSEIDALRARVAELEGEKSDAQADAWAWFDCCQSVDGFLMDVLGGDFPTDSDDPSQNTKAAIREAIEKGRAELEKDRERLDWCERQPDLRIEWVFKVPGIAEVDATGGHAKDGTIRQAIDAARKEAE